MRLFKKYQRPASPVEATVPFAGAIAVREKLAEL